MDKVLGVGLMNATNDTRKLSSHLYPPSAGGIGEVYHQEWPASLGRNADINLGNTKRPELIIP